MFIFNTNSNNDSIFSQDPTTEESVEAIKKGIEDIGAHIMEFLKSLRRKISYDEYLDETSKYIDEFIIQTAKSENLKCAGGYTNLSISKDKKNLDIVVDLYFKDQSDKWIQRTMRGATPISLFIPESQKNELMRIYRHPEKIEIASPEIK